MLLEFIPGKLGLKPGVTHGVDATKLIPVIFMDPTERIFVEVGLDGLGGFLTVDDHCLGSWADKLSEDTDFFAENPGFKSDDFLSIPRLYLDLIFKEINISTKYCIKI